jgi:hypothetical protein
MGCSGRCLIRIAHDLPNGKKPRGTCGAAGASRLSRGLVLAPTGGINLINISLHRSRLCDRFAIANKETARPPGPLTHSRYGLVTARYAFAHLTGRRISKHTRLCKRAAPTTEMATICRECKLPRVTIDSRGEPPTGRMTCNIWWSADDKKVRLSEEDLRALHAMRRA